VSFDLKSGADVRDSLLDVEADIARIREQFELGENADVAIIGALFRRIERNSGFGAAAAEWCA
jgi:hypothetical protein